MKKLICILLLLCCLTGCTAQAPAQMPEPDFLCAMYIPMGDGYVLIDSDRTPFTLSSVTELTDADGNALSLSDLSAGDILAIYMPGDMAASYPGILYGYDKLVLHG